MSLLPTSLFLFCLWNFFLGPIAICFWNTKDNSKYHLHLVHHASNCWFNDWISISDFYDTHLENWSVIAFRVITVSSTQKLFCSCFLTKWSMTRNNFNINSFWCLNYFVENVLWIFTASIFTLPKFGKFVLLPVLGHGLGERIKFLGGIGGGFDILSSNSK